MTPQAELAELEEQLDRCVTSEAGHRNGKAIAVKRYETLTAELDRVRQEGARHGDSQDWRKRFSSAADALGKANAAVADHDAGLEAAASARRQVELEILMLKRAHMGVFLRAAMVKAERAEGQLAALAPGIGAAAAAWQEARLAFARLGPVLGELLREQEEAGGTYAPVGRYRQLTHFPAFPLPLVSAATARPPGAALLAKRTKQAA